MTEWYPHCRDRVADAANPARQGMIRAIVGTRPTPDAPYQAECIVQWDDRPDAPLCALGFVPLGTLVLVMPRVS